MSGVPAPAAARRPMDLSTLRRYAALDDRRRRRGRRGLARLPGPVGALLAGVGFAGWLAWSAPDDPAAAAGRTVALAAALFLVILCGAPFRLFWRRDSALLARMPLAGRPLFGLAALRTAAATGGALLAVAPALAWIGRADPALAARPAALIAALAALAALAGPAVALAAGALVASDQARAAIASVAGDVAAPRTVWLGSLPAVLGSALVLLAIDLAGWAAGGRPPVGDGAALVAVAIGLSLAAAAWSWWAADRAMPGALREVAALDRERLAHVDRSRPSPLERAARRLWLREGGGAGLAYDKDASLTRRRYPSPYALGPLGVLVAWGLAWAGGPTATGWAVAIVAGLAGYAALMARRAWAPPIELARLAAAQPIAPAAVARAKRAAAGLRSITWVGLAGAPLVIQRADAVSLAAWLIALAIPVAAVGARPADG